MTRSGKTQSGSTGNASTLSISASAPGAVRERRKGPVSDADANEKLRATTQKSSGPAPLRDVDSSGAETMVSWTARNRWIVLAIASGACAAFNGVFAKLTTNDLSTHIARGISGFLGLTDLERFVEVVVRASFFGLNLAFNGVMWTLFTQALTKGHSTTQVSIVNTSTNFVITALLGLAIFAESLPPLWWAGAALLVAGNVIIGRGKQEESREAGSEEVEPIRGSEDEYHDEASALEQGQGSTAAPQVEGVLPVEKDDEDQDEDVALLGDLS
ncbi:hypothetical protein F4818DRAFT_47805 [Hypoxylon cercidicola]|nr:hypothetical protein F4818DRAFT_47805 [Hypoxylon cercidicola]